MKNQKKKEKKTRIKHTHKKKYEANQTLLRPSLGIRFNGSFPLTLMNSRPLFQNVRQCERTPGMFIKYSEKKTVGVVVCKALGLRFSPWEREGKETDGISWSWPRQWSKASHIDPIWRVNDLRIMRSYLVSTWAPALWGLISVLNQKLICTRPELD